MNKLVVLTDLGTFKAYRLEEDTMASSPRLEPVDAFENAEADDRLSRRVTDQAGQFQKGGMSFAAVNDGANGERHNIQLEDDRRCVKVIAERMTQLLAGDQYEACYLAAGNEINNAILDALPSGTRAKIKKNVHSNLVNLKKDEVLKHFA